MSSMHYVLRLKNIKDSRESNRVSVCEANSIEEATSFFIQRKQTDSKTFNKLYIVEEEVSDRRGK